MSVLRSIYETINTVCHFLSEINFITKPAYLMYDT